MKKIIVYMALILSISGNLLGQETSDWTVYPTKQKENSNPIIKSPNQKVTLISSGKLDELIEKDIRISEANPTIPGYRIQIFYGSGPGSKTEARNVQSEYVKAYPEIPSYLVFQTPNFKIRIGDFRSRLAAEKHLREIKETFPNAFIVKDKINLPKID